MRKINIYRNGLLILSCITGGLLILISMINYYGDGGNLFFRATAFEEKLANGLLNKANVLVCTNYNDRSTKKILLSKLKTKSEILVLGSSRTLAIKNISFQSTSFFNASVTSASLEDHISLYYLFHKNGWHPHKIVLGLDPWLVTQSKSDELWRATFLDDYSAALKSLFAIETQPLNPYQRLSAFFGMKKQLISPYYLSESLKNLKKNKNSLPDLIINPSLAQLIDRPACHLHQPNGSRLTSMSDDLTTAEQADYTGATEAQQFTSENLQLAASKQKLLETFIAYLEKQPIELVFFLSPYEPAAFIAITKNHTRQNLTSIENYYRNLASQYHIKVIGSYNPFTLGLSANDFVDDIHLKTNGINKLFL